MAFTGAGAGSYASLFQMALPASETSIRSPEPMWNALNRACLILLSEPGIWLTIYLGRSCQGPSSRVRNIGYLGPVVRCG